MACACRELATVNFEKRAHEQEGSSQLFLGVVRAGISGFGQTGNSLTRRAPSSLSADST